MCVCVCVCVCVCACLVLAIRIPDYYKLPLVPDLVTGLNVENFLLNKTFLWHS